MTVAFAPRAVGLLAFAALAACGGPPPGIPDEPGTPVPLTRTLS